MSNTKKTWFRIGPGLIIALAISVLIGSQWIRTKIAQHQQPSSRPIVERQIISSSYDEKLGPTPELKFIIERREKLHLTNLQAAKLMALQSKWAKAYGPKIAHANQAAAKTQEYLDNAKGQSRTPVAQVQTEAAPLIALSREISSARRAYWNEAAKLLTSEQRANLEKEREADWARK
ncbi:MAG: hypothetical protein NT018_03710 [Armatimonadetes bacterium]|nr:hypothetical protein [Armatimonadota bacterium]